MISRLVHVPRSFLLPLLLPILLCGLTPAQTNERPKIRTITAFVRVDTAHYKQQLADAAQKLSTAKKDFEQAGWMVQTIRITTQPFPEIVHGLPGDKAFALLLDMDSLAAGNYILNIGPAIGHPSSGAPSFSEESAMFDLLAKFLAQAKASNASAVIAGEDGIHWSAIRRAAHLIKHLADNSPHGDANFRFAAAAMVPEYVPFYPASYHNDSGGKFAIGLESANVVTRVLSDFGPPGQPQLRASRKPTVVLRAPSSQTQSAVRQASASHWISPADAQEILEIAAQNRPREAERRLTIELSRYASDVEKLAQKFANESGWEYLGLDPTPASNGDISIAAAVEAYTGHPFGSSGTLDAVALITRAVRAVAVKKVGYSGMMLPVLEDNRLAQRWSEGKLSPDAMLSYSSVCATGLDTIPLSGDISEEQIARILSDVASLAFKWHKPLTARLLPSPGKHAGDTTEFSDPFLNKAKIQSLP